MQPPFATRLRSTQRSTQPDHGSRACLELVEVKSKRTVVLLRQLLKIIDRFGQPKVIRTDNEAMFRSHLFRWALALLGIRHQRIAPFAPWQNGRIERFFGTLKSTWKLRQSLQPSTAPSQGDLAAFRCWYNHLRPHQNLNGRVPAEAWSGKLLRRTGTPQPVEEWNGALKGYFWPSG